MDIKVGIFRQNKLLHLFDLLQDLQHLDGTEFIHLGFLLFLSLPIWMMSLDNLNHGLNFPLPLLGLLLFTRAKG
jgi:hypothetical protein